jgi:3-oxoadipate enol-lactonase
MRAAARRGAANSAKSLFTLAALPHRLAGLNAYTLVGDPNNPRRAALIHSLAMDREFWRPVAGRMDAAVLLYDCTGHGASPKPAGPYTVAGFADDLARLLDHLGWDKALVAGASMGGCVALAFMKRHQARACALGLVDTTAWYGADAPRQWEERAQKGLREGMKALVDFQVTRWFSDAFRAARPEVVAQCVSTFLQNDIRAYAETCRMLGAADLRGVLPAIDVPTAIVVGEQDYATPPAMAQELHRGIRGSTLTVLEGARHLTPLERPVEIAAQLRRLLDPVAVA